MKTHAIVFSVPDVLTVVDRLRRLNVPYRLNETGSQDPLEFPRLFVGQSNEDPCFYDPRFDAGLVVEFVPTAAMALRPSSLQRHIPDDVKPGCPVRVESRSAVVSDLDSTVATLEHYLDMRPARFVDCPAQRSRAAIYEAEIPASASFELIEPTGDGLIADHLERYGPGAFRITLAVHGLAEATDRLTSRGIGIERSEDPDLGTRLSVDSAALAGSLFDLVEA